LKTLFVDPPFTIIINGTNRRVANGEELKVLLASIRSTEDIRNVWSPLGCRRKRPISGTVQDNRDVNDTGKWCDLVRSGE
jgi:hypothetical protein